MLVDKNGSTIPFSSRDHPYSVIVNKNRLPALLHLFQPADGFNRMCSFHMYKYFVVLNAKNCSNELGPCYMKRNYFYERYIQDNQIISHINIYSALHRTKVKSDGTNLLLIEARGKPKYLVTSTESHFRMK